MASIPTMRLSQEQLTAIRQFISKRGFTAIDLQLEIIDHVACRVEDKLRENPALCFEQALQQTHAEFGVHGFSVVEESMIASLNRKYLNQVGQAFMTWITFPRVIITGGIAMLLYHLFFIIPPANIIISAAVGYMGIAIWALFQQQRLRMRYGKMLTMSATSSFVFFPGFILQFGLLYSEQITAHWTWASGYTLMILLFAFLFTATFRVMKFATDRCLELRAQYLQVLEPEK